MDDQKIKLDVSDWNIHLEKRKRNRMKITVKLNKEQAEGFKAFQQNVKPPEIGDDEFLKLVFFNGVQRMNEELYKMAQQYVEDHGDELAASGVNIIEDEDGIVVERQTAASSEEVEPTDEK